MPLNDWRQFNATPQTNVANMGVPFKNFVPRNPSGPGAAFGNALSSIDFNSLLNNPNRARPSPQQPQFRRFGPGPGMPQQQPMGVPPAVNRSPIGRSLWGQPLEGLG